VGGRWYRAAGSPRLFYNAVHRGRAIDPTSFITAIITNGIGVVCCAVVLWFMYYRETKTIPALMQTFTETLAGIQKENGKSLSLAQESFERRNKALLDTFGTMSREERQTCQRWHEENREDLRTILQEQKETRHYIRNLAHAAELTKAADEAERKLMEDRESNDAG
jgi:hypothetical protein